MNNPEYIVVHHSWSPDSGVLSDFESIKKYHMEVNGWADIGYNVVIDYINGVPAVMYGRPVTEAGAHALGFNERSIGICVLGNYDKVPPPDDKWQTLLYLCYHYMVVYRIPLDNIIGHCETYDLRGVPREKTCPGLLFDMAKLRNDIKYLIA